MKIPATLSRLALVGVALALTAQLVRADASHAEVMSVQGTATINGTDAKRGDSVATGAQIATGEGSALDLFLGVNGPTIAVGANTRVTLEELTADVDGPAAVINTKLKLDEGRVSGVVKKTSSQSSYTVVTPTITAAIRGTRYMVTADGFVYVWDGCVDVSYNGTYRDERARERRGSNFLVCAGQAFDPRIPGIILNELPEPPVGNALRRPGVPIGPERPLSPIQPFIFRTTDGNSNDGL